MQKAYSSYIQDIVSQEIRNNPSKFYGFFKSKNCNNIGVSSLKYADCLTYSGNKMKGKDP